MLKQLTGEGQQRGRHMRQNFFTFDPVYKLFIDCNHPPQIDNPNDAIWNRIKSIPFSVEIPKSEIDRNLRAKLQRELSGILNWIVEGARIYLSEGLGEMPKQVEDSTEKYRAESDAVQDFLAACCELGQEKWTLKTGLYKAYVAYCARLGERENERLNKRAFEAQLLQRGYQIKHRNTGDGWLGVELKADGPASD
jgi:putative DNA primase/helicase